MEISTIRLVEPAKAASLAKLAEKTFRDAFAQFINKEDFESYTAFSSSSSKYSEPVSAPLKSPDAANRFRT